MTARGSAGPARFTDCMERPENSHDVGQVMRDTQHRLAAESAFSFARHLFRFLSRVPEESAGNIPVEALHKNGMILGNNVFEKTIAIAVRSEREALAAWKPHLERFPGTLNLVTDFDEALEQFQKFGRITERMALLHQLNAFLKADHGPYGRGRGK